MIYSKELSNLIAQTRQATGSSRRDVGKFMRNSEAYGQWLCADQCFERIIESIGYVTLVHPSPLRLSIILSRISFGEGLVGVLLSGGADFWRVRSGGHSCVCALHGRELCCLLIEGRVRKFVTVRAAVVLSHQ